MTIYTVYNINSGTVIGRGLSAVGAAQEILGHDSHTYELRHIAGAKCWQLFVSRGSAASFGGTRGMTEAYSNRRLICSYAATESEAWNQVAELVIGAHWEGHPEAMTDADYDAMMAEIEVDK